MDVRGQIEFFHSEKYHRGPDNWMRNWKPGNSDRQPALGTRVSVVDCRGVIRRGRWVPCWNNIARLVMDDGSNCGISTCELGSIGRITKNATPKRLSWWWLNGWGRARQKRETPRHARGWDRAFTRTNAVNSSGGGGAELPQRTPSAALAKDNDQAER